MVWCSYRGNGRSPMSSNAIITRPTAAPRGLGRIAPRERRRPVWALASERVRPARWVRPVNRVHPAEQAYAAELAHAERVRASGEAGTGEWRPHAAWRPARMAPEPESLTAQPSARGQRVTEPVPAAEQPAPRGRVPGGGERRRWIALAVLCLGQLMVVLDATIVNVALPSIQRDLHF